MLAAQLSLPIPAKRPRGRPRVPEQRRGYVVHGRRPEIPRRTPVHVTLKLRAGLPSLRRKEVFSVLRRSVAVAREQGLEVVHFSILSNHLHFLLEPSDTARLGRTIQSFAISFARGLNRLIRGRGAIFADRYHLRLLRSPTEVRRALAYVLSNESRHAGLGLGVQFVGPFSSSYAFDHWGALFGKNAGYRIAESWSIERIETWLAEIVVPPRTWLLKEGWRRGAAS